MSGVLNACVFKITVSDTKCLPEEQKKAKGMSKFLGGSKKKGAGPDNISLLGINMSDGYRKTLFLACEGEEEMMSWVYAIQGG